MEIIEKVVNGKYEPIRRAIEKIIQGYSNLCMIKSPAGLGKSTVIEQELKGKNYVRINGDISEAYLYRILYENNGKIIWFNDLANLLSSVRTIGIFKAATETKSERSVSKGNYSTQQEDLPDSFICQSALIFDFNTLYSNSKKVKIEFETLKSRGDYIELVFSKEDLERIFMKVAKNKWQRKVTKFLLENIDYFGQEALNLRTQYKAFKTYQYAIKNKKDWKKEVKSELEQYRTEERKLVYQLIGDAKIKMADFKRLLIKAGYAKTMETARRRTLHLLELGEIKKVSEDGINPEIQISK
jgi:hypothetical protein